MLTSGSEGYLFSIDGKNLKGWNPKVFSGDIKGSISHIRVRGKDYIAAFLADGRIDIVNRRGDGVKDFPLNLGSELKSNGVICEGNSNGKTYFGVITKNSKGVLANLSGKIISSDELSANTIGIVKDRDDEDIVVFYEQNDSIVFRNIVTGQRIQVENTTSGEVIPQFYNISGFKHYILTDRAQNKSTIYYQNEGKSEKVELNSSNEISMLYSSLKKLYRVYLVHNNKVQLVEF